jgi:quercetin dioxygenase-like cupin family protein
MAQNTSRRHAKVSIKKIADIPAVMIPHGERVTRKVLIGADEGPNFAMRVFRIEPGGYMPMHTNEVEHEQYVLAGKAKLVLGSQTHTVVQGDAVYIPALLPHSYEAIGDEAFEFICVVPNLPDETKLVS